MSAHARSFIAEWPTNSTWKWAVVPATRPDIYIPAPTKGLAESIAVDIDCGGVHPTTFVYKLTTPGMLTAIKHPLTPAGSDPR